MSELSDTEKQLLAREVAADRYGCSYTEYKIKCPECCEEFFNYLAKQHDRSAVQAGWDAAMEYVDKQREDLALRRRVQDAMDGVEK